MNREAVEAIEAEINRVAHRFAEDVDETMFAGRGPLFWWRKLRRWLRRGR